MGGTMNKPQQYRKKPVVIEALRYDGGMGETQDVKAFVGGDLIMDAATHSLTIKTLEGDMHISPGDYIIKGVQGEFYPCKPDIFKATYEEVFGSRHE
jgi:hypothetical protein